ncbi:MAG: FMN-dependent NADH-azoreductase, partial [Sphingomonadales bacterium]|nr:FMN-dependent NADH-azoreductase [Sphingomonadales bacterium]
MYNFGMPSTLKAWFDHVLRAGITFRYSEAGPEGLVTGKKAIVVEARAGLYSEGPAAAMDSQEPHLRTLLGFMGIDDVTFVRAEKLAFGPDAAAAAIAEAIGALESFAETELPLAA